MRIIDTRQLPEPVADWLRGEQIRLKVVDNDLMRRAENDRAFGLTIEACRKMRAACHPIQ